jgi:hypothetical protein
MDLSSEVLINSEYRVICPQCLCQLQIVGDYAYIPHDTLDLDTSVEPSRTINCPKCGHEANTNAHFCPNCGASFDTPSSTGTAVDTAPEDVTVLPPPLPNSDPLYHESLKFLMTCTAITPMMLRDRFHISDERAAELIRQLEAAGAIGPYNNGGPRQILIPHRNIYSYSAPQTANQGNGPVRPGPQPRRMSCLTMVLITMFFMFLIKACGG